MAFPQHWPPQDSDLLQLYSMATPNGQKIGIALEELGLAYEPHFIDINRGDQRHPDYLALNPNGKIPVILDPHGPEDEPIVLAESVVILCYLADKSGSLLPMNYRARLEHQQWLTFQAAHIGPFFGQFGHFYKFARDRTSDSYALERYAGETRRLLEVLDERLRGREFLMGDDYSVVDIAVAPWVDTLDRFYDAHAYLRMAELERLEDWRARVTARPAYQRGRKVCAKPG